MKRIVTFTLFIGLCFALVGCNQEAIKESLEIQAETLQIEHIVKKTLQLKNVKARGIKLLKKLLNLLK
jgi:hypothetical protein